MVKIRIYNKSTYNTISNLKCANTYKDRLIGLMNKKHFDGLIFKQKSNLRINGIIHTHFMRKTIDVLYINTDNKVSELTTIAPWKYYIPRYGNIKYIIELPEGIIDKYEIITGNTIEVMIT